MPAEFLRQYEIFFKKAHGDLKAAEVLFLAVDSEIDLSVIMFHLQQAAEKFLKSLISHQGTHFEKIHDLQRLMVICRENGITLPESAEVLVELNPYAVEGRYALIHDDMADAERFIRLLKSLEVYVSLAINIA